MDQPGVPTHSGGGGSEMGEPSRVRRSPGQRWRLAGGVPCVGITLIHVAVLVAGPAGYAYFGAEAVARWHWRVGSRCPSATSLSPSARCSPARVSGSARTSRVAAWV